MKAAKIRLHVRKDHDHELLRQILGTVRWTYNQCVNHIRSTNSKTSKKILRSLFVNNTSDAVKANPWLLSVGYDIRDDAVKDLLSAMKGNFTKLKNGTQEKFQMQFRSKKKQRSETFYLRSRWITRKKNTLTIHLPKTKPISFWVGKNAWKGPIKMDCKFQRTWTGEYYLCIPYEYGVENQDPSKKEETLRVCSLDPGVRTFQTIFDATNNCAYEIAPRDMNRIVRMCIGLDKLCSKRDTASNAKKRYRYKRAVRRFVSRIRYLIDEVHRQLAKFLASNYDLIMIPSFETSQMVRKGARKLRSNTVRQMLGWAHYRFRQRLIFKCQQSGTKVAVVNEAYTSKTCSACGNVDYKLGGRKIYSCSNCKMVMDRDINGAKNIFLKNYEALGFGLTLGPTPSGLVTDQCTETAMSLLNFEVFENFEV
ncbi:MAG: RNA-guided endonuclease InsQ/TnpB family protein [Candidatus Paceibacterota bacterium]